MIWKDRISINCALCNKIISAGDEYAIDLKRNKYGDLEDIYLCSECGFPRTCHDCGRPLDRNDKSTWEYGWGPGEFLCPQCVEKYLAVFRAAGEADARRGRPERPLKFFRRPALY